MKKPVGRTRPKQALSWICIAIGVVAALAVTWMIVATRPPPPITSAPQAAPKSL